jgi:hypothetical protein
MPSAAGIALGPVLKGIGGDASMIATASTDLDRSLCWSIMTAPWHFLELYKLSEKLSICLFL